MNCSNFRMRLPGLNRLFFSGLMLAISMMSGCSKNGPSKTLSSSAFDSAPSDIKQLWTDAMISWKSHRYPQAATNFASLQSKTASLSKEQADALAKAVDEFGQ